MTSPHSFQIAPVTHTPGPWAAEFTDTPYVELGESWVVDAPSGSICTLDCPMYSREANARLIAAAPELLAALREAKGLADMAVMSDDGDGTPSDDQASLERLRATIDAALAKAAGAA